MPLQYRLKSETSLAMAYLRHNKFFIRFASGDSIPQFVAAASLVQLQVVAMG